MKSVTESETYKEGIKKVGPNSKFYYRCKFDPTPVKEDKDDDDKDEH